MNFPNMFLDIETGRDDALTDAWIKHRSYHAPGNWKDPKKIASNIAEQKESDRRKAALNPLTLRVGVISYALDDQPVKTMTSHGPGERDMLTTICALLESCGTIITFKGLSFDLPALKFRMFHFGLLLPMQMRPGQKPWDHSKHLDLQVALQDGDRSLKGTLGDFCRFAGVPGPEPHDGSEIAKLISEGKMDKPARVCASDVEATRNLYNHAVKVDWI